MSKLIAKEKTANPTTLPARKGTRNEDWSDIEKEKKVLLMECKRQVKDQQNRNNVTVIIYQ